MVLVDGREFDVALSPFDAPSGKIDNFICDFVNIVLQREETTLDVVVEESFTGGGEMVTFRQAYNAVVARYSGKPWINTTPAEFAEAIYLEMRRIDAEAAKPRTPAKARSSAPSQADAGQ